MKRRSTIISFLLMALMALLPLQGEAQSISRNKKQQTTKITTKKKPATNSSTTTKSKQSSSSNSNRKPKKSNKTTPKQLSNSSKPPIYTSNMTQAQKDSIIQQAIDDMILVEAGTFIMGATTEQGREVNSDEKPAHQVSLKDFYIGKYEVTQELWEAVMNYNPSMFDESPRNPVECVSWNDCQTFIKELNRLTGKRFRLPTEAEWEYAARGGKLSRGFKYSGSNRLDDVKCNDLGVVGRKSPNELGLYDMSGSVWEWCEDWYGGYGSSFQSNPSGPSTGTSRVRRGGSRVHDSTCCRVSCRSSQTPSFVNHFQGLRLAM